MDFIERIFHISPDGGSGLLEFAMMLVVMALSVVSVVSSMLPKRHGGN